MSSSAGKAGDFGTPGLPPERNPPFILSNLFVCVVSCVVLARVRCQVATGASPSTLTRRGHSLPPAQSNVLEDPGLYLLFDAGELIGGAGEGKAQGQTA